MSADRSVWRWKPVCTSCLELGDGDACPEGAWSKAYFMTEEDAVASGNASLAEEDERMAWARRFKNAEEYMP